MENRTNYDKEKLYDVIIIGGGPAGLTAALYLARAKYRVLVLEKAEFGGQITITSEVVNYPGIGRASGKEITETMKAQGEYFGAEFLSFEAISLEAEGVIKTVRTKAGDFYCLGILIATGAQPRSVGFKGEEEYKGHGVAYCATCDGEFFTDKEIFVVGGGYAAAEESVFLTKFARHVTVLIRGEDFSCAAAVSEPARSHKDITVLTNTVVEEVRGDAGLNYIRYKNTKSGEVTQYRADEGDFFGVFVLAGYVPDTKIVKGLVRLDEQGYIVTNAEQKTSVDGIFAAGDVCIKPLRQIVTATADGALAATELERYVASVESKTGISARAAHKNEKGQDGEAKAIGSEDGKALLSEDIRDRLRSLFGKMNGKAVLKLYLDEREVSEELKKYMVELASVSDKIKVEVARENVSSLVAPYVSLCRDDGTDTGIAFHGVPGGHEFSSFVLGIYNAFGGGAPLDDKTAERIKAIKSATEIKLLVTLSCSMCPETVISAEQIAALNANVRADIYDIRHFDELRKKYNVMSVPCIVINDGKPSFGKKNISEILDLIE